MKVDCFRFYNENVHSRRERSRMSLKTVRMCRLSSELVFPLGKLHFGRVLHNSPRLSYYIAQSAIRADGNLHLR